MTLAVLERLDERLSPLERLEALTDAGSLQPLRTQMRSRRMGERARPGDGVLAAHAQVDGRNVYCYAQDASFAGGSLGEAHAKTIIEVLRLAGRARVPVVGFIESAGARMQEGLAALSGYGSIFREHVALSGLVPQISIVCGPAAGGSAYGPALNDFVIMTARSAMFLTGPAVVTEVTGEKVDMSSLGGTRVHERNGVCHLTAPTELDAARMARDLLAYLPQHGRDTQHPWPSVQAPAAEPDEAVPSQPRKVYDVRRVAAALVEAGSSWRSAPAGRATSSARWPVWRAGRSGSSPTSPSTSEACSTRARRRRRPVSFAPATRSGCRCWCSWTPRASCPAPARSATA
jgi:methylmalonyl-CoA decarboxylase subunit alpha